MKDFIENTRLLASQERVVIEGKEAFIIYEGVTMTVVPKDEDGLMPQSYTCKVTNLQSGDVGYKAVCDIKYHQESPVKADEDSAYFDLMNLRRIADC